MLKDRILMCHLVSAPLAQVIYLMGCWPSRLELRRTTERDLAEEETLAKTAPRTVYWKLPLSRLLPTRTLSQLNGLCFVFLEWGGGHFQTRSQLPTVSTPQ